MGAVAVKALRDTPLPTRSVDTGGAGLTEMTVAVLAFSVAGLAVAWAFLLAGALLSHWSLAVAALGLFSAATFRQGDPGFAVAGYGSPRPTACGRFGRGVTASPHRPISL